MTEQEIFEKVREIIIDAKSEMMIIAPNELSLETNLGESPIAMDSIDFVRMVIGIEETFGIIAEDEDFLASSVATVKDVVKVIHSRLSSTKKVGNKHMDSCSNLMSMDAGFVDKNSPAIITREMCLSHLELEQAVTKVADSLRLLIESHDLVGISIHEPIKFILAVLAVNSLSASSFLVHYQMPDEELQRIIKNESATVLISDRPRLLQSFSSHSIESFPGNNAAHIYLRITKNENRPTLQPTVHMYTSGSTGQIKGVIRSEASLIAEAKGIKTMLELFPGTRVLCPVPLCHAYGFGMGLLSMLASGSTLVLFNPSTANQLLNCVKTYLIEVIIAVPAQYELWSLAKIQPALPANLMRLCISSGAPLHPSVARAFETVWGKPIAQQYGMSECGPIALNRQNLLKQGWIGQPYPGVVLKPNSAANTEDMIAELFVVSPYAANGYVGELGKQLTKQTFSENGIRTGDLCHIRDDNLLYLAGRVSAQINVHGRKVDPVQVEEVIAEHPGVSDVAVIGIQQKNNDQWIAAFVVCADDVSDAEILALCKRSLAPYKHPRRIIRLSKIPKTSIGKVMQQQLQNLLHPTHNLPTSSS